LSIDPPQFGTGIGAELVGDAHPDLLVPLQGFGPPAAPVQCHQQAGPQRLAERMSDSQVGEPGDEFTVPPLIKIKVEAPFQRRQVLLGQPGCRRRLQPSGGHTREGVASPESEGSVEQHPLAVRVLFLPGPIQQPLEPERVHIVLIDVEQHPGRPGLDQLRTDRGPQPGQVGLQAAPDAVRRLVRPQPDGQPVDGNRLAGRHRQHDQ